MPQHRYDRIPVRSENLRRPSALTNVNLTRLDADAIEKCALLFGIRLIGLVLPFEQIDNALRQHVYRRNDPGLKS